jgi:hypothetical protein
LMKSSRAISRVSWLKITDVSGTISDIIKVWWWRQRWPPETSEICNQLTRLTNGEHLICLLFNLLCHSPLSRK